MSNIEIFNKSTGYIAPFEAPKKKSKLKYIDSSSIFKIIVQNGRCILFENDLFPDLLIPDSNKKLYLEPDDNLTEEYIYGDIKYSKCSIDIDDYSIQKYVITLGRRFFSEINLARQRDSVEKIVKMIVKVS